MCLNRFFHCAAHRQHRIGGAGGGQCRVGLEGEGWRRMSMQQRRARKAAAHACRCGSHHYALQV